MSLQDEIVKVERVVAASQELLQFFRKIEGAGMPPHTDFWHQSIWEHEQNLKTAIEAWRERK